MIVQALVSIVYNDHVGYILQIQAMLDNLSNEWTKFTEALVESEVMLKKYKEKFKTSLLAQAEDFKKQVKYSSVCSITALLKLQVLNLQLFTLGSCSAGQL